MRIRKFAGTLLAAAIAATSASALLAALPAGNAAAEAEPATLTNENAALFLPDSYEQYLALDNPTSVAMSGDYIAIADGNILYIYDRAKNTYSAFSHYSYEHTDNTENISKVQIAEVAGADNDRIFFSDTSTHLYEYETGKTSQEMIVSNVPAQTFIIDNEGKSLFTANAATERNTISIIRYTLADGKLTNASATGQPATLASAISPNLTIENGTLYVAYNNTNLAHFNASSLQKEGERLLSSNGNIPGLQSVCAFNGSIYYTVKGSTDGADGLYRTETAEPLSLGEGKANEGLSALTVYNGSLYCIRGGSVLKLAVNDDGTVSPADYEIAAASSSVNRLSGGADSVRAGDLLVTADKDNDRISVYHFSEEAFTVLPCAGVNCVATDGEMIAAATSEGIFIYESVYESDSRTFVLQETKKIDQANIIGVVCVYDAFYYVTSDFHYGKIAREGENWVSSSKQHSVGTTTPKSISADLFGDIYVADNGGKVYKLDEDDFATDGSLGDSVADIGSDFTSLRAGFDGTLYFLDGSKNLCMNDGTETKTLAAVDGKNFVYTGDKSKQPVSFALGYENDEVYFCFGDFIVKSDAGALGFATLESVSRNALKEARPALQAGADPEQAALADLKAGSVGIRLNLAALLGTGDYSAGYHRFPEARRAVFLADYGDYSVTALYEDHVYTVELFRTADLEAPVPAEREEWTGGTMYLSSDCPLYLFPCIIDAPARGDTLARGARVSVLSVVREGGQEEALGGYDFAYIQYETEARAVCRGYVPLAYLTAADPLGDRLDEYALGYAKPGAVFTGSDGSEVTLTERTLVRLYANEDGSYTACYEEEGVTYTATLSEGQIEWGESDALRIALIVILSVLAVGIVGAYIYLLPRGTKQNKTK